MSTNQNEDSDELRGRVPDVTASNRLGSPRPGSSRPRHRRLIRISLLVLTVVAVISGLFLVINRDSERSESRRDTAKTDTGPNKTLVDYFSANGITQNPVRQGDTGAPSVTIPIPAGWSDAGSDIQPGAYTGFIYDNAANPDDVPFIEVLLSRLDGAVDMAQVLRYATGELNNLPDYRPVSEPASSQLSGFEAVELGGLFTKNGEERVIAQKTVAIPTQNGMFVLQMNAEAPKADALALQLATASIDQQARIVP